MTSLREVTFPLWADNPAERDLLGFGDVAAPVEETVLRDRLDPVSIGLIGPWGSGKTTILGILERELERDLTTAVVSARPWEYDPALDVKATLIGQVLATVRPLVEAEEGTEGDLKRLGEKLVRRINWTKALTIGAKTALTLQLPSWDSVLDVVKDSSSGGAEADPTLAGFRKDFEEYLSESARVTRVVVLVDDLDRCLPETVVSILEGIKLFLAVPKMAFVIAYDEAPVVDAIKERYQQSDDKATMAKQYLEKIVQIPVRVPNLGRDATEAYLGLMLAERPIGDELFRNLASHADQRRAAGHAPYLEGHGLTLGREGDAAIGLGAALTPVLYGSLEGNPRRLKRFLNAFWIRSSIAKARRVELDEAALAKLMVLEELHRERFAELVKWSAEGLLARRLAALEGQESAGGDAWVRPELVTWAELHPPLAGIDLVPYMQLAASLSQLTFSTSGLSAELQALITRLLSPSEAARKLARDDAEKLGAEDRHLVLGELVNAIRQDSDRQGEIAEAFAPIVNGSDDLARPLMERLEAVPAEALQGALVTWLRPARGVPSVRAFLQRVRDGDRYREDAKGAARRLLDESVPA